MYIIVNSMINVWLKYGRNMAKVWLKYGINMVKVWLKVWEK